MEPTRQHPQHLQLHSGRCAGFCTEHANRDSTEHVCSVGGHPPSAIFQTSSLFTLPASHNTFRRGAPTGLTKHSTIQYPVFQYSVLQAKPRMWLLCLTADEKTHQCFVSLLVWLAMGQSLPKRGTYPKVFQKYKSRLRFPDSYSPVDMLQRLLFSVSHEHMRRLIGQTLSHMTEDALSLDDFNQFLGFELVDQLLCMYPFHKRRSEVDKHVLIEPQYQCCHRAIVHTIDDLLDDIGEELKYPSSPLRSDEEPPVVSELIKTARCILM